MEPYLPALKLYKHTNNYLIVRFRETVRNRLKSIVKICVNHKYSLFPRFKNQKKVFNDTITSWTIHEAGLYLKAGIKSELNTILDCFGP